jgi:hypothetical protein
MSEIDPRIPVHCRTRLQASIGRGHSARPIARNGLNLVIGKQRFIQFGQASADLSAILIANIFPMRKN